MRQRFLNHIEDIDHIGIHLLLAKTLKVAKCKEGKERGVFSNDPLRSRNGMMHFCRGKPMCLPWVANA